MHLVRLCCRSCCRYLPCLQSTKHVDIRMKYVNEYVEDGIIKIIFVQSGDNDSDIMTKNVNGDLLDKHAGKLIGDKMA